MPVAAPLLRAPARASPASPQAFITCVGLHPIEPIQALGLSSGEVCLYSANTDALSWYAEMEAVRQNQLRLDAAASAHSTNSSATSAVGLTPPLNPVKVLQFTKGASACSIVHCGFLRGREEDLMREVVQPLGAAAHGVDARHLLYVITSANDIFVVDGKSELLLVQWAGAGKDIPSCPLSTSRIITQVETYGALLFLTVAKRSDVAAVTRQRQRQAAMLGGGAGPERNLHQRCNEPVVYVLHLGHTKPHAAASTKALASGGGAYMIKAVLESKRARASTAVGEGGVADGAGLSIRAHPFAPLLLLLLHQAEVQVYAIDGEGGEATPKRAQLLLLAPAPPKPSSSSSSPPQVSREHRRAELTAAGSSSAQASPLPSPPQQQQQPILDAQFVPSAAVLESRSSSSTKRKWSCRNVQILLLTPSRLRLVCTRAATRSSSSSSSSSNDHGGLVAVDRAFYAAASASAAPATSHVGFVRVWTWLGSPDTVFVQQTDRLLVELSCNELLAASTDVPAVRSRRLLPPRVVGLPAATAGAGVEWWFTPTPTASPSASTSTGDAMACVQWPDMLPLWGRGVVLGGLGAPRLPAFHGEDPQLLLFSRLTGLARPLPIGDTQAEEGDAATTGASCGDVFHVSLIADADTISTRCITVRLCLTPRESPHASVNVSVARVLCESAATAPALCRLEHGFYFVGSRGESAYADYPFLVAGLLYLDGDTEGCTGAGATPQLRVAMLCLPADTQALQRLYEAARAAAAVERPTATLKRALAYAVRHTQAQPLPMPRFDFEARSRLGGAVTKQLLSCAFQLSNDGEVPCVWGLWAPTPTVAMLHTADASAALAAPPPPQPVQLTMQTFYVTADTQELRWRPPELVQMDDLLASNPSQVFALGGVLSNACAAAGAASSAAPLAYKSVDEALADVDPAVVARLFLYYADRKVLVLATVETGAAGGAGEADGVLDDTYNFASRARNGRVMGGQLFTRASAAVGNGGGAGRQFLRLVPHAAAEMNEWKAEHAAESLSCSLFQAVQVSAVVVADHGDPVLQVAVVSRRFGVACATFPLAGRRGVARVSASLQAVKVHLYRPWTTLLDGTSAVPAQAEESGQSRHHGGDGGGGGGAGDAAAATGSVSPLRTRRTAAVAASTATHGAWPAEAALMDDVQHAPLLRRYRVWRDAMAHPSSAYAAVPLAQWVWPPAWGSTPGGEGEAAESAVAATSPVLLLQRGRSLYLMHGGSGAAVQVCASLLHCAPLQLVPRAWSGAGDADGGGELLLQHGNYSSLVARTRLLRQLQLQHVPVAAPLVVFPSGKSKWFSKFVKKSQSTSAASQRVMERPRLMQWWQRVYTPTAGELAYEASSARAGAAAPAGTAADMAQMDAALENLTGAGTTHVGDVVDVDVSHSVRLATLAVEALFACQGMQRLVSAAGILTAGLRESVHYVTAVLEGHHSSSSSSKGGGCSGAPSAACTLHESWPVAEALARLPLECVTRALAHEALRSASPAAVKGARPAVSAAAPMSDWWWLVMRSSSLVAAVNPAHADAAQAAALSVLDAAPATALFADGCTEAAAVHVVAQALLLCSPTLMPTCVLELLRCRCAPSTSATPEPAPTQAQRLRGAVAEALTILGSSCGADDEGADGKAATAALFATVCMNGAHWTHAVYYANLLGHLRQLAGDGSEDGEDGDAEAGETPPPAVRTVAAECVRQAAESAAEGSAAAVCEVAAQTLGVLLGSVVDVPAASRTRMATAVAQSMSKRQQAMQQQRSPSTPPLQPQHPPRVDAAPHRRSGVADDDVFFLEAAPADALRHRLYAVQWRDVYGVFGYPTRYFYKSATHSSSSSSSSAAGVQAPHFTAAELPMQLRYSTAALPRQRRADPNAAAAAEPPGASVVNGRHGRVNEVLLTEQPPPAAAAAGPLPPVMELVPVPSTPMSPHRGSKNARSSDAGSRGGASATAAAAAAAPGAPPLSSPLSIRAAVAREEADLHRTYFDAFTAASDAGGVPGGGNGVAAAGSGPAPAGAHGGMDNNDARLLQFQARLQAPAEDAAAVSASATRRRRQEAEERQRVPGPAAFAPSATRRAAPSGAAAGTNGPAGSNGSAGAGAAAGTAASGGALYGAVPTQQEFFQRFAAED